VTHPDIELIARVVASDDRAAFGELVRRHQSAVRGFLRRLAGGDAGLADDLAQETFIRAYRNLANYRGDSSFTTWILGIAHNQHRNARRRSIRHEAEPGTEVIADEAASAATHAADLRCDLDAAMEQLSPDEQMAVHLFYKQGLSQSEIAKVAGWPLGTVKTHLSRGKEKLRRLLAAWNPQT
jgi:RNA polymerase sigma factor (sigma-70 family)